jgi:hypothetical protein
VDGASIVAQKVAVGVARYAETALIAGAKHVLRFERGRRHGKIIRSADDIVFGQVDEALLFAARGAAGLALKTKAERHASLLTNLYPAASFASVFSGEGARGLREDKTMKISRFVIGLGLALGTMVPAASTLSAAERSNVIRGDYRDLSYDHRNIDRLRDQINRDQARLNQDMRRGRWSDVRFDRQRLARDQAALRDAMRDVRHDRADAFYDRHVR